jgi:hypothetical protein
MRPATSSMTITAALATNTVAWQASQARESCRAAG